MKNVYRLQFVIVALALVLFIAGLVTAAEPLKLVSPGGQGEAALVGSCRPTFSWSAVNWAEGYELLLFPAVAAEKLGCEEMRALVEPLFEIRIEGQGLSWTPDGDSGLNPGQDYVWFVRPMAQEGPGAWSEAGRFVVDMRENAGFINDTLRHELSLYLAGKADSQSPFAAFANLLMSVNTASGSVARVSSPAAPAEAAAESVGGLVMSAAAAEASALSEGETGATFPRGAAPDTKISLSGPVHIAVDNTGTSGGGDAGGFDPIPIITSYNHSFVDLGEVLYSSSGIRLEDEGYNSILHSYYGGSAYLHFIPDYSIMSTDLGGTLRLFTTEQGEDAEAVTDTGRGLSINEQGNVGIGTLTPSVALQVVGADNNGTVATVKLVSTSNTQVMLLDGNEIDAFAASGEGGVLYLNHNSGANVQVPVLKVTGGSDFSEQFDISRAELLAEPGMVVSIDPEHAGKLQISRQAYDRKVAGIISGAGGVNPGMMMGQNDTLADGAHPVALSGRVYCRVDAGHGSVQPGDLLTTSPTPGHAMKVGDYQKAQGSIIGKAMTSLAKGRGLVLVLVSLQ
ncbi:MAG: hypothetical protein JXR80_07770 [Deltaproteobacteria bacterium]|nr:hypothetical protein [Deltaproteobacteria bacterium]